MEPSDILNIKGYAPEKDIWFEDIKNAPSCTDEQLKELGELLVKWLENPNSVLSNAHLSLEADTSPRIIFVSLSQNLVMAKVYLGTGPGLMTALKDCYHKLQPQLEKTKPYIIKIDLINTVKDLGSLEKNAKIEFQFTLEGIGFSRESKLAILPEQILSNYIFSQKNKTINYHNIYKALLWDPLAGTQLARLLRQELIQLYSFTTKSIVIKDKNIQFCYRGKPITTTISLENIKNRLEKAAFYLARSVNQSGKFNYIFHPDINFYPQDYNMVRHAGTLYSMLEYQEFFPNETVLKAATRGFNVLFQQILEGDIEDSLCVVEQGVVRLGAVALTAVALAKYISVTKNKKYFLILLKLGNFLLGKIQKDGRFKPQNQFYLKNISQKDTESPYYPGEAALALLRIYALDKNARWLEGAEKATEWLINVRDKGKTDLYPDHWLLYTLNELYSEKKKDLYFEHAKRLCQSILTKQIKNSQFLDWNGGYYNPPRSTPAATRGEGLFSAYCLFKQAGEDKDFLEKLLNIYHKIIAFEFSTQLLEESAMFFSNPIDALGAFHASHTFSEIRIDYVQHNISSILGYYKIMSQQGI